MALKIKYRNDQFMHDDGSVLIESEGVNRKKTEKKQDKMKQRMKDKEKENTDHQNKDFIENNRNVVIFTGKAMLEILRDETMQKSFMTLAYICDMMVGSEITPIQK